MIKAWYNKQAGAIKTVLLTALILFSNNVTAQSVIPYILKKSAVYVSTVPVKPAPDTLYLPTDFASPALLFPEQYHRISGRVIEKIELVYTTFRESDSFNQYGLNYQRLLSFQKAAPEVFLNNTIEWKLVAQTGCRSSEQGKKMFHGFVVYLRPEQNEKLTATELFFLDTLSKSIRNIVEEDSILYFMKSKWDKQKGFVPDSATAVYFSKKHMPYFNLHDSTIMNVLNRNKWSKMLMVVDVTGSMTQSTAQLMIWHKEHFKKERIRHFVFFNDGDQKGNSQKKELTTGGIYHLDATTAADIAQSVAHVMQKGNGGDAPENDVEAVLDGIKNCPECNDIVLVADNLANMRDFAYITNIGKPVHIILANQRAGVNPQYLALAYATHGSIHTAYEDIPALHLIPVSGSITIGGIAYKFNGTEFIPQF